MTRLHTADLLTICTLILETSTTSDTIETCYKLFADNWYEHLKRYQLPATLYYNTIIPTLTQALANNKPFWQTCNVK